MERRKRDNERRRESSLRPEEPMTLPTSYTTSWDLTSSRESKSWATLLAGRKRPGGTLLTWGHRWGHAMRIHDSHDAPDPLNHAVFAQQRSAEWAVKDSNLRPWD